VGAPNQTGTMSDTEVVNFALSNAISGALYPMNYVKVLMQLGYEPCPPKPGKSFFGKPILLLPGILGYSSHIYNRAGFGKLYDGVFPYLLHKNMTSFVDTRIVRHLKQTETEEEEPMMDIKDFVILTAKETVSKCTAVIIAQPFHVIAVRSIAQYVGGECTYNALWGSIVHIWKNEGVSGFFSGLAPSLIYESLVLVATNAMVYAFNSLYTEKQGDELANWPPYIFNMAATSMFYPLVVVSNCMAVTGSGLAAGQPDNMPRFQNWRQCYRWLASRHELKRGGSIWFQRRYLGPQTIIDGCAVPLKCEVAF